jgi:hypothetical protein
MSQIQTKTSVLEDGDAALLAGGQAQVLGEGEEFVDLSATTVDDDEPAQPAAKKEDDKGAAAAAAAAAAAPAAGADDDLPPEYRGKTAKEIAKMHMEAQQAIGRQGSELGELRRWADTLVRSGMARRPAAATAPAKSTVIEESQVFAKPIETINALVENHPVVQELRRTMGATAAADAQRRMVEAKQRFDTAHPDWNEIVRDPSFRTWVEASPKRRQMLLDAHSKYDFESGDEVFSTWKALNKKPAAAAAAAAAAEVPAAATDGAPSEAEVSAAAATLARARAAKQSATQAAAQAAAAPTGGASTPAGKGGGKKLYRRAEVINLMINDPDKYEAMSGEIQKAYAEGRVR